MVVKLIIAKFAAKTTLFFSLEIFYEVKLSFFVLVTLLQMIGQIFWLWPSIFFSKDYKCWSVKNCAAH